jgi:hypothetical protein
MVSPNSVLRRLYSLGSVLAFCLFAACGPCSILTIYFAHQQGWSLCYDATIPSAFIILLATHAVAAACSLVVLLPIHPLPHGKHVSLTIVAYWASAAASAASWCAFPVLLASYAFVVSVSIYLASYLLRRATRGRARKPHSL